MPPLHLLAEWSATHHGVVTHAQLGRLGYADGQIVRLERQGALRRAARGVYLVAGVPATPERSWSLACAGTAGAISFVTAGTSWSFRGLPTDLCTHVTIEHRRVLDPDALPPGVVVHRTRALPASDLVRRPDGIVVTSPPRTLFDLAAVLDADALESAIEQGIDRGMFTVPTLWAVARRLARRGRPGSGRFVDVLASRPVWVRPAGSELELVLVRALADLGLPAPVRQHPVDLGRGRTVHLDLAWPDLRLGVEVDHVTWHGGRLDTVYDKRRDRHLRLRGWEVDRVTDEDLRVRRDDTAREIAALHARRAADLARVA